MANTWNYLKDAFLNLKQKSKPHPHLPFLIALLLSVPMLHAAGNISMILLSVVCIYFYRLKVRNYDPVFILPLLLYGLMLLSLAWTANVTLTLKALPKEIPLLIIPLCFMFSPEINQKQKNTALKFYGWGMVLYSVFYLLRAGIRFLSSGDTRVFFYHELVTKDVNAIHVSAYIAISFFWFLSTGLKSVYTKVAALFLFLVLVLLTSKNILLITSLLMILFFLSKQISAKVKLTFASAIAAAFIIALSTGPIKERFALEYHTAFTDNTVNQELSKGESKVYNVSVNQAWNQERFEPNHFFPGAAMRVYQIRVFCELLVEDNIWVQGYGLNASLGQLRQKAIKYNIFMGNEKIKGYHRMNFHNQYIQNFVELGIFGILLLIAMLTITLVRGVKAKDFVHISFAVIMISLFLTETFLWRQRGVMFFTAMYCLLNSGGRLQSPKPVNEI